MDYSTSVKEASTKVIVAKTVIIINHLAATQRVDHCRIAKSILQLSNSKNEGGHVHLCQNSVAFMLPTTVAAVEHMLTTTVALGSFSAALILLSPSMIIFSSDFAAECFFACVSQVKATCFQPK